MNSAGENNNTLDTVNKLFVEVFKDIVKIEHNALRAAGFEDITTTEAHTVEAIKLYGDKTMSAVADKLDITVGTLTVSVANLVKKGYVIRSRDVRDRRRVILSPTQKGEALLAAHGKFHREMVKSAVLELSENEAEIFKNSLTKLSRFFTENNKRLSASK